MFEAFKATQKRRRRGAKTRFIRSGTVLFLLLNGISHKKTPIFTHLRGTTDISGSSHAPNPVKQQPRSCEKPAKSEDKAPIYLFIAVPSSRLRSEAAHAAAAGPPSASAAADKREKRNKTRNNHAPHAHARRNLHRSCKSNVWSRIVLWFAVWTPALFPENKWIMTG